MRRVPLDPIREAIMQATGDVWENLDDTGELPTRRVLEQMLGKVQRAAQKLPAGGFAHVRSTGRPSS